MTGSLLSSLGSNDERGASMLCSALVSVCRRNCIQAKRLPGMHPFSAAQWCHSRPGGKGKDHPGRTAGLPGSLQQLWLPLSEQRPMCGENQWLFLPLCQVSLHRDLLWWRYIFDRQVMLVNTLWKKVSICKMITSPDNTHNSSDWSFTFEALVHLKLVWLGSLSNSPL